MESLTQVQNLNEAVCTSFGEKLKFICSLEAIEYTYNICSER